MALSESDLKRGIDLGKQRLKEQEPEPVKLAVLISDIGSGTNLQAIIDAIEEKELEGTRIALVASNKPNARGLERAKKHNIPYQIKEREKGTTRETYGEELGKMLNQNGVQVTVLAGFDAILAHSYFKTFKGVTINIHPGLIPDQEDGVFYFPDKTVAPWNRGLMTEAAVANFINGKYAGSTIHVVTEKADFGPVLKRVIVPVEANDTIDSLYSQKLKPAEHKGLIAALKGLIPSIKST